MKIFTLPIVLCVVLLAPMVTATYPTDPLLLNERWETVRDVDNPAIVAFVEESIVWINKRFVKNVTIPTPEIKMASTEFMEWLYKQANNGKEPGGTLGALYYADNNRSMIFLDEATFDFSDTKHQSILLHEAVHAVQYAHEFHKKLRCVGEMEVAAYRVQIEWLIKKQHFDSQYIKHLRDTARKYRCR